MRSRVRSLLRRAVYRLPVHWQLRVTRGKRAILRQYDWAIPIKRVRLREQDYLDQTTLKSDSLSDRKRIIVWTLQQFPPWVDIGYVLATAMRLRGHDVRGMLCDGLLPVCEMNLGLIERPPCETCIMSSSRYEDAFGFTFARLSDLLFEEDREKAERLVAQTPNDDLLALVVDDVRVGALAKRELQRYYRGFVFDPLRDDAFRQWLVTAILLTWLSARCLDRVQPDIVIASSGKTLPTACLFESARRRGIHVVTWDTSPWYPNGLLFSHNKPAVEVDLGDEWKDASKQALSGSQLLDLNEFLRRWARSENTPFPYNTTPLEDEQTIRHQLGLRLHVPIVAAFANTSWDMAVADRDVGFESMFDWIFSLVEYAIAHPEIDLVVRAHPAEKKVPLHLQSRTPVAAEIRKRYEPLPPHIKLIEGDNPVSSYILGVMAHVVMVYNTGLGMELALGGKRPWIAGDVTYRGKGFTRDLISRDQMLSMLDAKVFDNRLSKGEVELAQRFAYLWIFRHVVRNPFVDPNRNYRFTVRTFRDVAHPGHPVIEELCEAILTKRPFIDIGHARSSRQGEAPKPETSASKGR